MNNNSKVTTITPSMAAAWLQVDTRNRSLGSKYVERYANAMKTGNWKFNGETIKISMKTGAVIDGQHRLHACIKAGVSFVSLVVYINCDEDVILTVDGGKHRSHADTLKISGLDTHCGVVAAAAKTLRNIESAYSLTYQKDDMSRQAFMEYFNSKKQNIMFALETVGAGNKLKTFLPQGVFLAFATIFCQIDKDDAICFLGALENGAGLASTNPIFLLRERLVRTSSGKLSALKGKELSALIIVAWNKFRENQPLKTLKWASGGGAKFPVPK